jgi:hypothetical protein
MTVKVHRASVGRPVSQFDIPEPSLKRPMGGSPQSYGPAHLAERGQGREFCFEARMEGTEVILRSGEWAPLASAGGRLFWPVLLFLLGF